MNNTRKVHVRAVARLVGWIFVGWGVVVALKGVWDCFWGAPEANYFSLLPWEFVTREEWLRYAGFELAYGLACVGVGWAAWRFARRLPEWVEKEYPETE